MRSWLRDLRARPASGAFLIVSLALSLAAGLTALAVYSAVHWRPLPFRDALTLVSLELLTADHRPRWWLEPELDAIAVAPPSPIEAVAGFTVADFNALSEPGRAPEALLATLVSHGFFDVLGIAVRLGRPPAHADYLTGARRVVVLGHEFWQRRYGSDPAIVGRTIRLGAPAHLGVPDDEYEVIGVLGPEAWLFWKRSDVVVPIRPGHRISGDVEQYAWERIVARVAPGGAAAPTAVGPAIRARLPQSRNPAGAVVVEDLATSLFRDLRPRFLLVLAVAWLVVALAMLNVVIAISADALDRQRDTAIRQAVGATPRRLARDAAGRTLITAGAAGVLAVLLAGWAIDAIPLLMPDGWFARIPGAAAAVRVDAPVLGGLVAIVCALVITIALWTHTSTGRIDLGPLLARLQPGESPHRQRWRWALVTVEVAFSGATTIVATTLIVQLQGSRAVDLGVRAERTVAAWVNTSPTRYGDDATRVAYFDALIEAVRRAPGIEAVGAINLPFQFDWETVATRADADASVAPVRALNRTATPDYQPVTGLRLLDGRWIDGSDRIGAAAVAVISDSLARTLWPSHRAVGRSLALEVETTKEVVTVVGVVSDTRTAPHQPPSRTVYRPIAQAPPSWMYLIVRTAPGADVSRAMTTAIWRVDPDQPVDGPWSMQAWIDERVSSLAFLTRATALVAALGLVLACAGLFGLTVFWVQASTHELGVRRAVGATGADIAAWLGRRLVRVVGPGLLAGLSLQEAIVRTASASIEGLRTASSAELAIGCAAILAVAAVIATGALRRALRFDARMLMR
jgi:predicted permease